MSVDPRKDCRTQGKYSERNQHYEDKRTQKRQDKSKKGSPTVKEVQERKFYKRRSDGGRSSNTSLGSENESSIRYEENSVHTFSQLKEVKKPVEIKKSGKHILSKTENGESIVFYEPCFLKENEASDFMTVLRDSTGWHTKNIVINGEEFPQPRLVAWYGPFPYSYSGATLEPKEMPPSIEVIKQKVEEYLSDNGINVTLNSVLLNLYRNNKDSVAWHSDDELSMGICPTIASVSLGATRKFEMRFKSMQIRNENLHPQDEEYFIHLAHGSLVIMDGCMQKDWQHRVPKEYHDRDARINLTFRTVYRLEDVPPSFGAFSPNQSCSQVVKKCSGNKADYGIQYDDEDFPPLSNSSPVCSNVRKSGASVGIKSSEWNGSHKGKSNGTSRSKTSLKTNSKISESDDFRGTSSNKTDRIHSSDKITASEVSQNTVSGNGHYAKSVENNTSLETDAQMYESEYFWDTQSSPSNNREDGIIDRPENQVIEVSENKFSCDKIVSGNGHYNKPLKNTSLETDAQTYESEYFWDTESSPSNNKENGIMDRPENQVIEPFCSERGSILNNLNEDKNNVKIDMENKNLCAYASDFSSNNANVTRKNKNFQTKESHNVNPSSVNSMQDNIYAYKVNETPSDKNKSWTPNVKAKEFVPTSICTSAVTIPFDTFDLDGLLNYTIDLMDKDTLSKYAFALKDKVIERIDEFNRCQEELEILCELTDGDQTEKNQKLISKRMCLLVKRSLKYMTSPNYIKSYGNHRRYNHGNQNNFSGRKYYSSSRERTYRQ